MRQALRGRRSAVSQQAKVAAPTGRQSDGHELAHDAKLIEERAVVFAIEVAGVH